MQRSLGSFLIFFAVFSALFGGLHYYLWQRLVRAPELGASFQRWGTVVVIASALLMPAGLALTRALPRSASISIAWGIYSWMGVVCLLFFLLLGSEVVRLLAHGVGAAVGAPIDAERRTLLSRGLAIAVGIGALAIAGVGAASALGQVAIKRVRVPLRRLPAAASGFRVVQLSDVHIGPTIGRGFLEGIVARVNELEPDIVVITGDLVDGSVASLRDEVAPLAGLRSKHGVFFVTGNHEYYSGVDEWLAEVTRLGVRVLRNEHVRVGEGDQGFDLAGVDDWSAKGFGGGHGADLRRALEGRDPGRELVLLAHQPKQIVEAEAHGVGLQISGHTHGGQFVPWNWLVGLDQPYIAGLARRGDTHIYVSRGTGYWGPPLRVGAPAEITLLELVSA